MKNSKNQILYIGKAKVLRSRVLSYFKNQKPSLRLQFLVQKIKKIDYILTDNEVSAFLLEASLVKNHKPRYNIRLKDDKAYPYIRCLPQEAFPRFYFERKIRDKESLYFGPYTQGQSVRDIMNFLNQTFKIRDCSSSYFKNRKRPCLTHQIGFCTAPCVDQVGQKEYRKQFQKALQFLKGRRVGLKKELEVRMRKKSRQKHYEEAGRLRDHLKAIDMIEQNQVVIQQEDKDQDVVFVAQDQRGSLIEILHLRQGKLIGHRHQFFSYQMEDDFLLSFLNQYYLDNLIPDEILLGLKLKKESLQLLSESFSKRSKRKCNVIVKNRKHPLIKQAQTNAKNHLEDSVVKQKKMQDVLYDIQKKFGLPRLPLRMEAYDISHWQGEELVGSQVVFEQGLPKTQDYRLYKLKTVKSIDDYAGLREVLLRRFRRAEGSLPDLILIDGGKGQLRVAERVLKETLKRSLPLISLAKDRLMASSSSLSSKGERFYLPARKNPILFPSTSPALHLLLHLRDEAHRRAIRFHRKRRDKKFLKPKK